MYLLHFSIGWMIFRLVDFFANHDYDYNAVYIQSYNFHSGLFGFEPLLHKGLCSFNLQSLLIYWRCWDKDGNFSFKDILFGKCKSCKTQYCLNKYDIEKDLATVDFILLNLHGACWDTWLANHLRKLFDFLKSLLLKITTITRLVWVTLSN